jgi:hypothetical protein
MKTGIIASCLSIALLPACFDDPKAKSPTLTVEKRMVVDGNACFAPCVGSTLGPAKEGLCVDPTSVECGFEAGQGRLRVSLDYGDVELERTSDFTWPNVSVLADSLPVAQIKLETGPTRTGDNEHVYGFGELAVPTSPTLSLILQAQMADGQVVRGPALNVIGTAPALVLPGCSSAPCTRAAQVGRQAVTVSIAGGFATTTAIVTSWLDGVQDPTPLEVPLDTVAGGERSGTRWLNVPDAVGTWTLQARVGELRTASDQIFLTAPDITAQLQPCVGKKACIIAAGSTAAILVTAPGDTLVTSASVSSYVGGLLTGDVALASLKPCEGGVKCGLAALAVPKTGLDQSFRAVAIVGRFDTATEIATIGP